MPTPFEKLVKGCHTTADFLAIPETAFQEARREEQMRREKAEDAYWDKFSDFVDEHPIGHPRVCGLGGCHGD